jgi:long-chain acyl-CoA synthetase
VFVYGDSLKNNLIAIVVPEESVICDWAKAKVDISDKSMISLCKNAELKALILEDIGKQGKSGGLKGFEQVNLNCHV